MKTAQPAAMPAVARESIAAGADLREAQHAEQLAEAVEPLVEQRRDRFVGRIAPGDAGAAGRDDDVHAAAADLLADDAPHVVRLVA